MKFFQKKISLLLLIGLVAGTGYLVWSQYQARERLQRLSSTNPEFAKMSEIINRYKSADLEVVVDGYHRKPAEFLNFARLYLNKRFDSKMTAETWVKTYTYRSKSGDIIYFKYPDGSSKPMRDVFLEELAKSESAPSSSK